MDETGKLIFSQEYHVNSSDELSSILQSLSLLVHSFFISDCDQKNKIKIKQTNKWLRQM